MGMYTELNIATEIVNDPDLIHDLRVMLGDIKGGIILKDNDLFTKTTRWKFMLSSGSYYFPGQPDSKLVRDDLYENAPMYFLNVRCNLKNYENEIELFLKWLQPYMLTYGFVGYMRYEEDNTPTLIYNENEKIVFEPAYRKSDTESVVDC